MPLYKLQNSRLHHQLQDLIVGYSLQLCGDVHIAMLLFSTQSGNEIVALQ